MEIRDTHQNSVYKIKLWKVGYLNQENAKIVITNIVENRANRQSGVPVTFQSVCE